MGTSAVSPGKLKSFLGTLMLNRDTESCVIYELILGDPVD